LPYLQATHQIEPQITGNFGLANTLSRLGDTHHAAGNPQVAHDAWKHALTILDQLDHPDAQAVHVKLHHPDQSRE